MHERVVPMSFCELDGGRFEARQRDAVGDKSERIAQRFNRDAIGWRLCQSCKDEQQRHGL